MTSRRCFDGKNWGARHSCLEQSQTVVSEWAASNAAYSACTQCHVAFAASIGVRQCRQNPAKGPHLRELCVWTSYGSLRTGPVRSRSAVVPSLEYPLCRAFSASLVISSSSARILRCAPHLWVVKHHIADPPIPLELRSTDPYASKTSAVLTRGTFMYQSARLQSICSFYTRGEELILQR